MVVQPYIVHALQTDPSFDQLALQAWLTSLYNPDYRLVAVLYHQGLHYDTYTAIFQQSLIFGPTA